MKTVNASQDNGRSKLPFVHWTWFMLLAVIAGGCATQEPMGIISSASQPKGFILAQEGTLAVIFAPEPPPLTLNVPEVFAVQSRKDRAGEWARNCINPPEGANSEEAAIYSPIGVALAPLAAFAGVALPPSKVELNPNEITRFQGDIIASMKADQPKFRDLFMRALRQDSSRAIISLNSWEELKQYGEEINMVLEPKLEEVKLQPVSAGSQSFHLVIRASLIAHDPADRRVLGSFPVEYRSGAAPFNDWTVTSSFLGVMETGYRHAAAHLGTNTCPAVSGAPLLTGLGNKGRSKAHPNRPIQLAGYGRPAQSAGFIRLSSPLEAVGSIGIYPAAGDMHIALQRPLTKDEAVSEAIAGTEWMLDGLQDSRNAVVQLSVFAAAIPISIWRQGVAIRTGTTQKELREADKKLRAMAYPLQVQPALAQEFALQLAPRTAQTVVVLNGPPPRRGSAESALANPGVMAVALRNQATALGTCIEIRVSKAQLAGSEAVNPRLALCVDAEARLIQASDGQELYRCPIQYRSESMKFVQWAANGGEPFRREVGHCFKELSRTFVNQFIEQKMIPANQKPASFLAHRYAPVAP